MCAPKDILGIAANALQQLGTARPISLTIVFHHLSVATFSRVSKTWALLLHATSCTWVIIVHRGPASFPQPTSSQPAFPLSLTSPHFHRTSTVSMLVSSPGPHVPILSPLLDNRGLSKCRSSINLVIKPIHASQDTLASPRRFFRRVSPQ